MSSHSDSSAASALPVTHDSETLENAFDATNAASDYATRLREILGEQDADGGDDATQSSYSGGDDADAASDDDEDEEFLYSGADAPAPSGYEAQLADVLGSDAGGDDEETNMPNAVPSQTNLHNTHVDSSDVFQYTNFRDEVLSDQTPSRPRTPVNQTLLSRGVSPFPTSKFDVLSTPGTSSPSHLRPQYLHPSVSRLRSFTHQHRLHQRVSSTSTVQTIHSNGSRRNQNGFLSPNPSHFSAISRASSSSNVLNFEEGKLSVKKKATTSDREVFRWTILRQISAQIYSQHPTSAAETHMGQPTVLVANGLLCVGTDSGRTFVFDFRQQLKCVCGSGAAIALAGSVSALSLSLDHTFLAVGHVRGHIYLYDLSRPQAPVRTVLPADSLAIIASGRKEAHLLGSKIIALGFVGARHTALVSADDAGLAFYHSLGKVLFVEASDVLRILGKYPEPVDSLETPSGRIVNGRPPTPLPLRPRNRKTSTILAMEPLPLATSPHPTDAFNITALLTPLKLVIVGLKPTARTWYRRHRGGEDSDSGKDDQSTWRGCMAWFPSVDIPSGEAPSSPPDRQKERKSRGPSSSLPPSQPTLVYSWGKTLLLLRVRAERLSSTAETLAPTTSSLSPWKTKEKPSADNRASTQYHLVFEEAGEWTARADVLAIHWLNVNQIIVLTEISFDVYDIRKFECVETSPTDVASFASSMSSLNTRPFPLSPSTSDPGDTLSLSVDVYKGKIFTLGPRMIQAGTILSWADRILAFVQRGDFLSAIELTRSYYVGEEGGNKFGLPDDPDAVRQVVGDKLRDLMLASARYVFSEDRMTDSTHRTPDGRGVDRTSLFEGLVTSTARACIALDDFDFLFDDLYELYHSHGIAGIYLLHLQPFLLEGDIRIVPPRITQQLIKYHEERDNFDMAERVIWHIDPMCLDINQAIRLCQDHILYDALIYVYNRALRDFVSPVVELLSLLRRVQQIRRDLMPKMGSSGGSATGAWSSSDAQLLETLVPNAYKVYSYLGDILSGLTHPSQEPMPDEEALQAKADVYPFLFNGRSSVWQGRVVLAADEEGGPEPTYPYLRLLVRFDAEAMLNALDLAFEDSYLNDDDHPVSRQSIVDALLELRRSGDLSTSDITFIHIFIARNAPKYPQFIRLSPRDLRSILHGLAQDLDQSTREDRQLAAEYLLSVHSYQEDVTLLELFEGAGFFRILRTWNRQHRKWGSLISAYLQDDTIPLEEVFSGVDESLRFAQRQGGSEDALETVSKLVPSLLQAGLGKTADLLENHCPELHEQALAELGASDRSKQFFYLRRLVQPALGSDDDDNESVDVGNIASENNSLPSAPSTKLSSSARNLYVTLLCEYDPESTLSALESLPQDYFDLEEIAASCDEHGVYDAELWAIDQVGDLPRVFDTVDRVNERRAVELVQHLSSVAEDEEATEKVLAQLASLGRMAVRICRSHSEQTVSDDLPPDEMWFRLMRSQIGAVQAVSSVVGPSLLPDALSSSLPPSSSSSLDRLRLLVQETFSSLVQQSSSQGLSFPRLFRRLVDASSGGQHATKAQYTEFRLILGGMVESYRSESDFLLISNRLVKQDLYERIVEHIAARRRGRRLVLT